MEAEAVKDCRADLSSGRRRCMEVMSASASASCAGMAFIVGVSGLWTSFVDEITVVILRRVANPYITGPTTYLVLEAMPGRFRSLLSVFYIELWLTKRRVSFRTSV